MMDYFGTAIAIALFTLAASLWLNGPAVSAEQSAPLQPAMLLQN